MTLIRREGGATAVEFAIVLPLLLMLVGGIIDFGRLLFGEIMVANAAREGARAMAVGLSQGDAETRAITSMPQFAGLVNGDSDAIVSFSVVSCSAADSVEVTVRGDAFDWFLLDAFVPIAAPDVVGKAQMRCGG
ncbi:pilus assembly protein [Phycicoccus sp. BSK3Z-2]|uniref:Pilus assembly protein n=1 Tax=Phycicoccus avicenniae TaxID=2828860 RepID=A0A941D9A1_9MICO|nr:TadE/TadG family type IV pilus assembly protein [Phycicoccus avicenniae]MBR7743911.1 pilus assembly protein [Phycicoccus avicenniae]